jgi:16S rRNA (cytosine1402-N4)-methyltransferase
MVDEIVRLLTTALDGAYLDLTTGLGGHLKALSLALKPEARLYGFDKDAEALKLARENLRHCAQLKQLINASFADIDGKTSELQDRTFDGILLDLGLSSLQLDDPERGFAFQKEGPLDMRFDQRAEIPTAADLIENLNQEDLVELLRQYGEERQAGRLAAAIVRERQKEVILTTTHLADIVRQVAKPPHQKKSLARVFQALRIAVNGELDQLQQVLPKAVDLLTPGGRLAVISYHSLEDRTVKRFFRREATDCLCPPRLPVCICQHRATIKEVNRHVIVPTEKEIAQNSRARSAKLRIAEKI